MPRMSGTGKGTLAGRVMLTGLSLAVVMLTGLLLVGCGKTSTTPISGTVGGGGETVEASGTTGSVAETTAGVSSEAAEPEVSAEETPFTEAPEARGGSRFEADGILAARFGEHEGYERVVVDLGAGEKAARRVPEWTLTSPEGDSLLRVTFPSVDATRVSDGDFGGTLLKDFHVVRAPEGGMFIDILSRKAFTYRILELRDPARLVVDFQPSSASLAMPAPSEDGNTVVTKPRSGAPVSGTLTVSGYSRNPEASNTITLLDAHGAVIAEETVQGNDWSETWGYFETTLDAPPFTGKGTLKVGTASARDGAFEGVLIPVRGS